jgi:DNA ligase 1
MRAHNASCLQERIEAGVALVKQAYSECPSYGELVKALLCAPMEQLLQHCHLRPGLPVQPMLAKPEKSIAKVRVCEKDVHAQQ